MFSPRFQGLERTYLVPRHGSSGRKVITGSKFTGMRRIWIIVSFGLTAQPNLRIKNEVIIISSHKHPLIVIFCRIFCGAYLVRPLIWRQVHKRFPICYQLDGAFSNANRFFIIILTIILPRRKEVKLKMWANVEEKVILARVDYEKCGW
jgi:hypothetical protein